MTTLQLDCFLEAAATLNFTVAAEHLYTSQPALRRQIAMLEDELGVPLFDRHNNVVTLTPAGEFFHTRARELSDRIRETELQMKDRYSGRKQHLRIGLVEDQQMNATLSQAARRVFNAHSDLSMDVVCGTPCEVLEKLNLGEADICQVSLYDNEPESRYEVMPLSTEPLYLALNQSLRITEQRHVTNDEIPSLLGDIPLVIAAERIFPEQVQPFLPKVPIENKLYVESLVSIAAYVTSGIAVSIANQNSILALYPSVQMIEITDAIPMTQGVIWRKEENAIRDELLDLMRRFP